MERITRSGAILLPDERNVYRVWRCDWLVRDFSLGSPEPDSFADTFRDVPCGAIFRMSAAGPECDAGHRRYVSEGDLVDMERAAHEDEYVFSPATSLAHIG